MNTAKELENFGKKISQLRTRKCMSQCQLSSKIGSSQVTVQRIESGKIAGLRVDTFFQLALALDLSISDIFFEIEKNTSLAAASPPAIESDMNSACIKPSKKNQIAEIILKLLEESPDR